MHNAASHAGHFGAAHVQHVQQSPSKLLGQSDRAQQRQLSDMLPHTDEMHEQQRRQRRQKRTQFYSN